MRKILIALSTILLFAINTCSFPLKAQTYSQYALGLNAINAQNVTQAPFITVTPGSEEPELQELQEEPVDTVNNHQEEPAVPDSKTEPVISTITLSFVGDCTLGDDDKFSWNTFDSVYHTIKDPSYFLKEVQSVFAHDDFTFINLEGTLTQASKKAVKEYRYKGDPSYVDILVKGSVEGVTLANNHTLDYFQKGFEDTVDTLTNAGILYTYFDTTIIKDIKGVKIGFLGYKGWSHESRSNQLLKEHVKKMRESGVAFIIANYHWGDQKVYVPNALQKRMAHFAIDNGVDLVIGHHAHVLQGMEIYKGKNILYGLGNFCYGGSPNPGDKDTIIYQHLLTYNVTQKSLVKADYKIIPARISSDSSRNNYQPILAFGEEAERIRKKFENISKMIK